MSCMESLELGGANSVAVVALSLKDPCEGALTALRPPRNLCRTAERASRASQVGAGSSVAPRGPARADRRGRALRGASPQGSVEIGSFSSGIVTPSRKLASWRARTGWRSLRTALASIWRTRSRVTRKMRPTSSSV